MEKELREIIMQGMGEASMCWTSIEQAGEFDSQRAADIGEELIIKITDLVIDKYQPYEIT